MGLLRTREDAKRYLMEYNKLEQALKAYYKKHGALASWEGLPKVMATVNLKPRSENDFLKDRDVVLEEDFFIYETYDIAVKKHDRYFPDVKHSHRFIEMVFQLTGSCRQEIWDAYGNSESFRMQPGDLLLLAPYTSHSIRVTDDSVAVNILVRQSTFHQAFYPNIPEHTFLSEFFLNVLYAPNNSSYLMFQTGEHSVIEEQLYDIAMEFYNRQQYFKSALNHRLCVFFFELLRSYSDTVQFSRRMANIDQIPQIIAFMEEHHAHIQIKDIADHFNYEPSYLGKLFKQHAGSTLRDTLQKIKVNRAKLLLCDSDRSIDEIAGEIGYQNPSTFIRVFRKYMDMTPKQYRSTKRNA